MRKARHSRGLLLSLLINFLINPEGLIPAAVLTILHYALHWPIWPILAALGAWILWITLRTLIIGWAVRCSNTPDPPKENKNPYSAKQNFKKQELSDSSE